MARQVHTSAEVRLLRQLRNEVHRLLAPYRHTALLAAIIAAFLVRPLVGDNAAGLILFSSAMLLLLLLSLYNIDVDELVGQREVLLGPEAQAKPDWLDVGNSRDCATIYSYFHAKPFYIPGRFDCLAASLCLHYLE